ncbi:MAG TPA: glycosyltransferase family 39 protein [Blastocatellia bacterium]|nr:glycosyltransferase family 39 protein [Blastocatellia bacterium]
MTAQFRAALTSRSSIFTLPTSVPGLHLLLPLLLCLAYFLTLALLSRSHPFGTYATETDFYHYYAPDAERVAAGRFPENPFQGPGYPTLLALTGKLTGDLFIAGKWISILSATLVVWLAYLIFARLFGYRIGIGAALLVMVGGEFPQFAICATTDMFSLLLILAAIALFLSKRFSVRTRVALTGLVTGIAWLTRYNSVFLPAVFLCGILALNLFDCAWRERIVLSALLLVVFFVTVSPWLYVNWQHRGSPFYNTNYLNIATVFYGDLVGGKTNQDGTRELAKYFHSFGEVFLYDPLRIVTYYPVNLWESLKLTITTDLVSQLTGWFALAGFLLAAIERRSKAVLLLLLAGAIYFLLMGLNHWETRYYFFIQVLYSGLAVYAAFRLLELARKRGWLAHRAFALVPVALVLAMWVTSLTIAKTSTQEFLASHPLEVLSARDYIISTNAPPHSLKIVSRKPHLAYLTRQEWVFIPKVKSIDELRAWAANNRFDYLAISSREIRDRKELKPLGDPKTAPAWLRAVWVNKKPLYILYQPVRETVENTAK